MIAEGVKSLSIYADENYYTSCGIQYIVFVIHITRTDVGAISEHLRYLLGNFYIRDAMTNGIWMWASCERKLCI
jgi:hypothetical protein